MFQSDRAGSCKGDAVQPDLTTAFLSPPSHHSATQLESQRLYFTGRMNNIKRSNDDVVAKTKGELDEALKRHAECKAKVSCVVLLNPVVFGVVLGVGWGGVGWAGVSAGLRGRLGGLGAVAEGRRGLSKAGKDWRGWDLASYDGVRGGL